MHVDQRFRNKIRVIEQASDFAHVYFYLVKAPLKFLNLVFQITAF